MFFTSFISLVVTMSVIDTISISSCSDVVIDGRNSDELILRIHEGSVVNLSNNLLQIYHKGDVKIGRRLTIAQNHWIIYTFLVVSWIITWYPVFIIGLAILIMSDQPNGIIKFSCCNCGSVVTQGSDDEYDFFIERVIRHKHNIGDILIRGLGDVTVACPLASSTRIVSNGSGDFFLTEDRPRFDQLSAVSRRTGSVRLGNARVANAILSSEGYGSIDQVRIESKGELTINGNGDITYSCERGCAILKRMVSGRGAFRQILDTK